MMAGPSKQAPTGLRRLVPLHDTEEMVDDVEIRQGEAHAVPPVLQGRISALWGAHPGSARGVRHLAP